MEEEPAVSSSASPASSTPPPTCPPPAPGFLPSHTLAWSAEKRAAYPEYVAARESTVPSLPTPLAIGSRVIVDFGRGRDVVHITAGTVHPQRTAIRLQSLIGEDIGRSYELVDKQGTLKRKAPPSRAPSPLEEADVPEPPVSSVSTVSGRLLPSSTLPPSFLPRATNAELFDRNTSQKLSQSEIESAKSSSSPSALIDLLVQHSSTFSSKTEFSQEKYIAKKKRKHVADVTTLDATPSNTLDTLLLKDPGRILHMRVDTISQMLTAANVAAGKHVLLAETAHGNLLGCVAKRMGGEGLILNVQPIPLTSGIQPINLGVMRSLLTPAELDSIITTPLDLLATAHLTDQSSLYADAAAALQASVDSVMVATRYDPIDLFAQMFPFLRAGGNFCVHAAFTAPLAALHRTLRMNGWAVNVELTETWFREYQVLPNRTHPHVNMTHNAGYLLSGIKTFIQ